MSADVVIDPRDKKYFVQKPDASFSPQRNLAIIQEVHDDTRKYFAGLRKTYQAGMEDRVDILSAFANFKFNQGRSGNLEQYTGRALHTRLVGERLLEKVRVLSTVDKLQGRTKVQI